MALFRRLLTLASLLFVFVTGFVMMPSGALAAMECQCGCSLTGDSPYSGGLTCTTNEVCTQQACLDRCALTNALPGSTTGRLYPCAESSPTATPTPTAVPTATPAPGTPTPAPAATPTPAATDPQAPAGAPAAPATPRGSCAFQCIASTPGATPVTPQVVVGCSTDNDCVAPCNARCSTPGTGPGGNNIEGTPGTGLSCAPTPAPHCVLPNADSTAASTAAPALSAASFRFVLPSCTDTGNCTLTDIINTAVRLANVLLAFSGVIFLFTILYAGAQLLFFAYDASSIKKAQSMITGAAVGMVIIMLAGVAVRFVPTTLGVPSNFTRLPGRAVTSTPAPAAPPTLPAAH